MKFQSLLYWISHCGPVKLLAVEVTAEVSILVVLD